VRNRFLTAFMSMSDGEFEHDISIAAYGDLGFISVADRLRNRP